MAARAALVCIKIQEYHRRHTPFQLLLWQRPLVMLIEQSLTLVKGSSLEPTLCAVIQTRGGLAEGLLSLCSEAGGKRERMALFLPFGFGVRGCHQARVWRRRNDIFLDRLHQRDAPHRQNLSSE
jgi:hypothetical protein